jgi:hypothetical protein
MVGGEKETSCMHMQQQQQDRINYIREPTNSSAITVRLSLYLGRHHPVIRTHRRRRSLPHFTMKMLGAAHKFLSLPDACPFCVVAWVSLCFLLPLSRLQLAIADDCACCCHIIGIRFMMMIVRLLYTDHLAHATCRHLVQLLTFIYSPSLPLSLCSLS